MSIKYDQYTNTLSVSDTVNANASLNLVPQGTGGVNLLGTGQNFVIYSQAINGSNWATLSSATLTGNSTTAPDGTSTASTLTASGTQSAARRGLNSPYFAISGETFTASIYFKAGTANYGWISLTFIGTSSYAWFNLSTGTVGSVNAGVTSTITNVGNGWYRCSATGVSTNTYAFVDYGISGADNTTTVTAGTTIYLWGAQLEAGPITNTYVPTTSSIIYGTPQLTLSGVAGIGLQSDGSLYVQPAGTGALQANITNSATSGGNARGANAVDLQTTRNAASNVASGLASTISGGAANLATAQYSNVSGGVGNTASGYIAGVGSGYINTAGGYYAYIGGGQSNASNGYYNLIGGGFTNSGTSSSAVTTQSGTMNGTTAVTLSGSNASIKVGQYITGTSIAGDTYVAAISGTSLTLSKNASGSSTSTLSFYTPHGIVVGGGNNQATGSYSFIGGGGDAGTAGNRNTASNDYAVVGGGIKNVASGLASFIGGGGFDGNIYGNTASGVCSSIVGGRTNIASNNYSFVHGAVTNTASGSSSSVYGGSYSTTRGIVGNTVTAASETPFGTYVAGNSQAALLVLGTQTTDATATVLRSNSSAASGTNQVILPNNSAYTFTGTMIANVTGGGNTSSWEFRGCIKRGANAAATALVGTPRIDNIGYDSGASTWAFTLTADTSNGGLAVTVTGQASTTIRWVATINTCEVTY